MATGVTKQAAYLRGILTGLPGLQAGPTVVRYTTKTRNYGQPDPIPGAWLADGTKKPKSNGTRC